MVAEFVGRGQSGSPINGEIPQLNSNMPSSHGREMLATSTTPCPESYSPGYNMNAATAAKHKELFSQRKQREFTPDNKKDDSYWDRRRRNNEAAKRSREKRRYNDMILEKRVVELTKENAILKAQLDAIRDEYGICGDNIVSVEKVLATLPTTEQVLSITKRQKISHTPNSLLFGPQSPVATSVIHQPVMGSPPPPPLPHGHSLIHPPTSHHDTPYREHPEYPSYPFQPYHPGVHHCDSDNVLNLSARSRSRNQSPCEVSSNSGDEGSPVTLVTSEANNSLPLKLRHKSHLGDKDAASALLALQHIKQEPGPRSSPPWDAEGSSDERDSGISLGAEWSAATQAAATLQTLQKQSKLQAMQQEAAGGDSDAIRRYQSEIARLSTEVEHMKSMLLKDKEAAASLGHH